MKSRRSFLKTMAGITAGIALPMIPDHLKAENNHDNVGEVLPLRKLGNTGEKVTMLGVGGYHIGWTGERDAREVIEAALEGGVRFFDTAHNYANGLSETRYGKYLVPKYRDQIFLMTKSQAFDGKTLLKEADLSLKRLNTDQVDLLQIHSLTTPGDVDNRINSGVVDALIKIKEQGKARYIGFTGHQNPLAHLRMMEQFPGSSVFSTSQMPVNIIDFHSTSSFVKQPLPTALNNQLGVLAMKTLADGRFFNKKEMNNRVHWETDSPVIPGYATIRDALFFAWSMPISVLITGAENKDLMIEKIELAKAFSGLDKDEKNTILERAERSPQKEQVEYYKKV